jgi:hypothetical protein
MRSFENKQSRHEPYQSTIKIADCRLHICAPTAQIYAHSRRMGEITFGLKPALLFAKSVLLVGLIHLPGLWIGPRRGEHGAKKRSLLSHAASMRRLPAACSSLQ